MHPSMLDVRDAAERIGGLVQRTPVIPSPALSALAGRDVMLKLENAQVTGSFKIRGAASKALAMPADEQARGMAAVSSGNHGRALAYVGSRLGIGVTIFLTTRVPEVKVLAIEQLGAEVVVAGDSQDDAERAVRAFIDETGATLVHPYDDPLVIAGQGTVGLELASQAEGLQQVLVPLSGGGLISGVGIAVNSLVPDATVVGISQDRGAAMHESLRAGRIVDVVEEDTLADALAGALNVPNLHTFELCRRHVDETVLVSEKQIADAMAFMLREHRFGVEGGGAVGVAALMAGAVTDSGPVAVIVSGGTVDVDLLLATL